MRKDSAFIIGATALLTTAILGARTVPDVPAGTLAGRSARIIACDMPDGSKAFTNAASCAAIEDA